MSDSPRQAFQALQDMIVERYSLQDDWDLESKFDEFLGKLDDCIDLQVELGETAYLAFRGLTSKVRFCELSKEEQDGWIRSAQAVKEQVN